MTELNQEIKKEKTTQRRFAVMGENTFLIANKLMQNQKICRLLKYQSKDPFLDKDPVTGKDQPDVDGIDLINKQLLIVPKIFDDKNEIYNMTNHVIKIHNCRNIGFVTGTFELDDSLNRLNGFREAMAENGLEIDEEQDIFHGNYWSNQGDETAEFFARRKK